MTDAVAQYRDLLTGDESVSALDEAIRLARRVAAGDAPGKRPIRVPDVKFVATGDRIQGTSWALTTLASDVDALSARMPHEQYSFLMDVLLLVFHQAYFTVLPAAGRRRAELLSSFDQFAALVPNAADRFQITGFVLLEKGNIDAAVHSFRAALAATHSDQHDFLTRLQLLWMTLMEHQRWSDAFRCLLDVYPRVPRTDLEEVSGMLQQTFEESQRPQPRRKPA